MSASINSRSKAMGRRKNSKRDRLAHLLTDLEKRHRKEPQWAITRSREALRLADDLGDRAARFEILLCLGRSKARLGHLDEAEQILLQGRSSLPTRGTNKDPLCRLSTALGAVCYLAGKKMSALEHYDRALACDVDAHKGTIYLNLANLYFSTENYSKSLTYQKRALRMAERDASVEHQIYCLSNIGAIHVKLGKASRAKEDFERALALLDAHGGDVYMRCNCLLNLGEVQNQEGESEAAAAYYREALRLARDNKLPNEQAQAHLHLGDWLRNNGQEKAFLHHHYRCRKLAIRYGLDNLLIQALTDLQRHFEAKGAFKKAFGYLKEMTAYQATQTEHKQQKELSQQLDAKEAAISVLEDQKGQIEQQKRRLEKHTRDLEQSNRDLEQYAFVVAHDLKEPLRNISSFTSLLERHCGEQLDATGHEYMQFVVKNAKRMNALLTELLRYNTITQRPDHETAEVELEYVIQEILHTLDGLVLEKEAIFLIGVMPRLRMPHDHMLQLFSNLIENALRFSEPGSCRIELRCSREDTHFRFAIQDTGIGIQPEYHEKIFKLFQRLDRERYDGTGIGLALCRKIVQLYDGEIGLESKPGKGSTFWFTLRA